jgi:phosphatidylglycerophosphatase A
VKRLSEILATCFYIGYVPVMPATFGAAFGVILYWTLMPEQPWVELAVTVAVIALAVVVSGKAEEKYGHDGRPIVIDEVAGMFVSLCLLPRSAFPTTTFTFLVAFCLFRVFDISKPFPARRAQNLPGGWGVVMDDVFAGIYTNLAMRVILMASSSG